MGSREVSLARQEKSFELLNQASQLLLKEKENSNIIARKSKDYSGEIKLKINTIKKKFDKIGIKDFHLIEDITNKFALKKKHSKVKIFS